MYKNNYMHSAQLYEEQSMIIIMIIAICDSLAAHTGKQIPEGYFNPSEAEGLIVF